MGRKRRLFKRTMRRYKSIILKTQATVNFIIFIISACALDSESSIPTIICSITLLWLALFCYANNWFEKISYTEEAEYRPTPVYHYSFDKERKVM